MCCVLFLQESKVSLSSEAALVCVFAQKRQYFYAYYIMTVNSSSRGQSHGAFARVLFVLVLFVAFRASSAQQSFNKRFIRRDGASFSFFFFWWWFGERRAVSRARRERVRVALRRERTRRRAADGRSGFGRRENVRGERVESLGVFRRRSERFRWQSVAKRRWSVRGGEFSRVGSVVTEMRKERDSVVADADELLGGLRRGEAILRLVRGEREERVLP